ncbi:MAG: V-type ATP synthase subunit A, partial [Spirochaetia bacterium]|nr:V-type ATP synthase subunit A [Spirochaetia bacterium]
VVGAFHGLSRERSDARRYPSIDPLDSWSKYSSFIQTSWVEYARAIYKRGAEVNSMMKVVGEEGTSLDDFITYLKSEFLDAVYMQQDSFDETEGASSIERQKYVFKKVIEILGSTFEIKEKDEARTFFNQLRQNFIDMNYKVFQSAEFKDAEKTLDKTLSEHGAEIGEEVKVLLKDGE